MAMSNAERQAKWRAAHPRAGAPAIKFRTPKGRRSAVQRWRDAVATLMELQAAYQDWLDNLPPSLAETPTAEALRDVCAVDLSELEAVRPPRGYGRD
jgi:hypothetical protein